MTTADVLLVHGAWHGGWCFADLQAALTSRGITSRTVDLPSSGGIAELADDAAVVRASLAANPGPTLVLGHSYGGAVISEATAGADNVTGLVYLAAFLLPTGTSHLSAVRAGQRAPGRGPGGDVRRRRQRGPDREFTLAVPVPSRRDG